VTFGPWSPGLVDDVERGKQLRCLQGLVAVHVGWGHPLIRALRHAEHDSGALQQAFELFGDIPVLTQRRMLSTFGAVTWPKRG
jgi:hypothetical protein